jgi:hypothetical protein
MDSPPAPYRSSGIRPGSHWQSELLRNVRESRFVLAFLSPASVAKSGFVQREFRVALEHAVTRPPGIISLIPVLLAPCEVPDISIESMSMRDLQWFEMYSRGEDELADYLVEQCSDGNATGIDLPLSPMQVQVINSLLYLRTATAQDDEGRRTPTSDDIRRILRFHNRLEDRERSAVLQKMRAMAADRDQPDAWVEDYIFHSGSYGYNFWRLELELMLRNGWIEVDGSRIRLTPAGIIAAGIEGPGPATLGHGT